MSVFIRFKMIYRGYSLPDRIWEPPFVSACLLFEMFLVKIKQRNNETDIGNLRNSETTEQKLVRRYCTASSDRKGRNILLLPCRALWTPSAQIGDLK